MAKFIVESGGTEYEVEAPDMATATAAVRKHFGLAEPRLPAMTDQRGAPVNQLPVATLGQEAFAPEPGPGMSMRELGRIGAQTAGAVGGAALGAVAPPGVQPITMPAGGAAGSVLARQAYDALLDYFQGTEERPPLASTQTGIDAVAGALGPLGGSALRGGARAITGLRQSDFSMIRDAIEATRAGRDITFAQRQLLDAAIPEGTTVADFLAGVAGLPQQGARSVAASMAVERAGQPMAMARRGLLGGGVGAMFSPEPLIGGLVGAGISEAVLRRAVPALLNSERFGQPFAEWAFNYMNGHVGPASAARSLAAIVAEHQLTPPERQAVGDIQAELQPANTLGGRGVGHQRRNPFDVVMTPSGERGRDRMTGRFVEMGAE